MSDQRTIQIAKKLLERSRTGDVDWKETADENTFSVAYPGYSVAIAREGVYTFKYVLSVHNRRGTVVDSIEEGSSLEGDRQRMLKELFPLAQRIGVAADEVLDELLKELSSEEAAI